MQNWITSLFSHLSSKKFLEEHKTFQPHHVGTSVLQIHAKSIHNLLHPSVALRFKQYHTREVVQHQLEARDTVIERSRLAAITATERRMGWDYQDMDRSCEDEALVGSSWIFPTPSNEAAATKLGVIWAGCRDQLQEPFDGERDAGIAVIHEGQGKCCF